MLTTYYVLAVVDVGASCCGGQDFSALTKALMIRWSRRWQTVGCSTASIAQAPPISCIPPWNLHKRFDTTPGPNITLINLQKKLSEVWPMPAIIYPMLHANTLTYWIGGTVGTVLAGRRCSSDYWVGCINSKNIICPWEPLVWPKMDIGSLRGFQRENWFAWPGWKVHGRGTSQSNSILFILHFKFTCIKLK